MSRVQTDLNAAADYIEQNGWCRGSFYTRQGQVCLAGAVGAATGALLPKTEREIRTEIKFLLADHVYDTEKEALGSITVHKWSKSKARISRYVNALHTLASQIEELPPVNPDELYVLPSETVEEAVLRRQRNLAENAVIDRNDGSDELLISGEVKKKYRTTKRQAVKLLRTAAASV